MVFGTPTTRRPVPSLAAHIAIASSNAIVPLLPISASASTPCSASLDRLAVVVRRHRAAAATKPRSTPRSGSRQIVNRHRI